MTAKPPLTHPHHTAYALPATPHCVVGFDSLNNKRRTTAPISGFFVRTAWLFPRFDGLCREAFAPAGFVCASLSTLHSPSPMFDSVSDGFTTYNKRGQP